jgi:hydroxymethylglutaryl-CoA reductase (NADPH)
MAAIPVEEGIDWDQVHGQCCERVVGYIPVPVGLVGPMRIDGVERLVPMATTEGALIASTNRGAKALSVSGGVTTMVTNDGMTRAPVVRFRSLDQASEFNEWLREGGGFEELKAEFETTTRFGKLTDVKPVFQGRSAYLRFRARTGDAMGMNIAGKGTQKAIEHLVQRFPGSRLVSLSGNVCTDKKPAAVNWIEGRGKSVVAEARLHRSTVEKVLKTTIERIVDVNIQKNLVGSAMAGSIGGFNAHASNMVTAVFIACGQDPAQNVESSQCLTFMEVDGDHLIASVTMPCIEVGTVGGGTSLAAQNSALNIVGVQGPHPTVPGENARTLARAIAATVLAGELSLGAALSSGHLISAHMALNRKAEPSKDDSSSSSSSDEDSNRVKK